MDDWKINVKYGNIARMGALTNETKNYFALLFIVALLLGSVGIFHLGMMMQNEGMMTGCPFSPGVSLCTMSPLEMIPAAGRVFTALPVEASRLLVFLALVLVGYSFSIISKEISPPQLYFSQSTDASHVFVPFRALQEFFSRGILHPKLF